MTMQRFHFDVGNSHKGPIGFCASIVAVNRDDATALLNQHLAAMDHEAVLFQQNTMPNVPTIEYVAVYFNNAGVTAENIHETEDV